MTNRYYWPPKARPLPIPDDMSRNITFTEDQPPKHRLSILLLGKTGAGKSATGNTLLGRIQFIVSGSARSVTAKTESGWVETDEYILQITDGPGLQDTNITALRDKERACQNIEQCLAECPGGINAFVLVVKYADRFTQENREAVDALNSILGENWLRHYGIVVVTNAADWYIDNAKKIKEPEDWFREQDESFCNIFSSCDYRCVMLDNRRPLNINSKNPVDLIISHVERIAYKHGFYTNIHFRKAEQERDKLIVKLKEPMLKPRIQEACNLLTGKIIEVMNMISMKKKSPQGVHEGIKDVMQKANKLLEEIRHEDRMSGELATLEGMVLRVLKQAQETNLRRLEKLGEEIETLRREHNESMKSKDLWKLGLSGMGIFGAIFTGVATVVSGGVVGIAAGISAAASATGFVGAAVVSCYEVNERSTHEAKMDAISKYYK